MSALLELEDVEARYGPVHVLHGISLAVEEGSVVAVLGPNGAGKTTTLRAISGMVRRSGSIRLAGRPLGRLGPDGVARLGVAHVPEGRGTFSELTVWENLRLGAYTRRGSIQPELERVFSYFPWLAERRRQLRTVPRRRTGVVWPAHSGQRIPTGVGVMQSGQIGRPQLEQATLVSRPGCR